LLTATSQFSSGILQSAILRAVEAGEQLKEKKRKNSIGISMEFFH
jgi:hypothetical protein